MSSTEMMHDLPVEEEANIELEDSAEAEQPEQEQAEAAPEEPAKEKDEADLISYTLSSIIISYVPLMSKYFVFNFTFP